VKELKSLSKNITMSFLNKNTAKDAVKNGYLTYVVKDAISPVEREEGDEKKALEALEKYGVEIIDSHQVII
jgi:nicotinamidase-related amidase